ncbi:T9SS type A sorting domain-containing protein, partial [Litoribaculum gwangyangense]|uniref:T9SS type A sorting domain-containing protein n=1 Tax=Litoribaculum gwangyangense TaxID=1130722 RepID=UPI0031F0B9CD
EFGVTTGGAVLGLVIDNGLCASLDVAGVPVMVEEGEVCNAFSGTMYSNSPISCLSNGSAVISATTKINPTIPNGYQQLYVLTEAFSLTILNVSTSPEFEVRDRGFYRIHSLVFNPNTLDLSVVVPGVTTGFDVASLISDNNICASLDVQGAVNLVIGSQWFCDFFNRFFKNNRSGKTNTDKDWINEQIAEYVVLYKSYDEFKEAFIAQNTTLGVHPNPVVNILNVDLELFDGEVMNFNVYDASGRRVISGIAKDLQNRTQKIDTSILSEGLYLVQFKSEYRTVTEKIIVRK